MFRKTRLLLRSELVGFGHTRWKRKKHFITAPIFYVNSDPHLGHLYTSVIADARNRLLKLKDTDKAEDSVFSIGTDEHGVKVEKAAKLKNESTKQHCDRVSSRYRDLFSIFGVKYSRFIRTTDAKHKSIVENVWRDLFAKGFIYKRHYEGWYCESDETFVPESFVTSEERKDGESKYYSKESGHPVGWTSEENYMFKLSEFKSSIINWLEKETPVSPKKFNDLALHYAKDFEGDLSISRPMKRLQWGIPVPGDDSQVIYVWMDALLNYLTASKLSPSKLWPPDLQVIGKDILKFHTIYWPAFLMALDIPLPKKLLCHSHWTVDGQKMSKSLGNVVNPFILQSRYGSDAIRYFLLQEAVPHSDGNYSEEKLRRMVNAELSDTLGNLLSRITGKTINPDQSWPQWNSEQFQTHLRNFDGALNVKESMESLPNLVDSAFEEFNWHKGLDHIMQTIRLVNGYVEKGQPWVLVKESPSHPDLLLMIAFVLEILRCTSIMMTPVVPHISSIIMNRLSIPENQRSWRNILPLIWDQHNSRRYPLQPFKEHVYKRVKL